MLLRSALKTFAATIERPDSLVSMIAELERTLSTALQPARISISLTSEAARDRGLAIPLRIDGDVVGTILAESPSSPLAAEIADALRLLAAPIAAAIACRRRPERRGKEAQPANIDALCRIPNRRGFDEHVADAWERAAASRAPVVIALLDVDFFKAYNDRYGHVAGDECLQRVASLLVKRRDGDDGFAARYGGEEFAVVFEDASLEAAIAELQHIFGRLARRRIEHAGTTLGQVSLSAGVASAVPVPGQSTLQLIDEADRALYAAKRLGRNRICAGSFISDGAVVAQVRARQRVHASAAAPTFGRDDDLARLLSALRYGRILTLVGPRGIGKSRLLTLLADSAVSRLHRPVVFLEAELLRADIDVPTALASACDLVLDKGSALDTVTDFLAEREAVVIFDDVEPARTEIRRICSHLIARTSNVSIVAAAHASLGIAGERSIVVRPLDDEAAFELLAFSGGGSGAASREIVRYLGGNPASIQVAADAIALLGIDAVTERLANLGDDRAGLAEITALFEDSATAG